MPQEQFRALFNVEPEFLPPDGDSDSFKESKILLGEREVVKAEYHRRGTYNVRWETNLPAVKAGLSFASVLESLAVTDELRETPIGKVIFEVKGEKDLLREKHGTPDFTAQDLTTVLFQHENMGIDALEIETKLGNFSYSGGKDKIGIVHTFGFGRPPEELTGFIVNTSPEQLPYHMVGRLIRSFTEH